MYCKYTSWEASTAVVWLLNDHYMPILSMLLWLSLEYTPIYYVCITCNSRRQRQLE